VARQRRRNARKGVAKARFPTKVLKLSHAQGYKGRAIRNNWVVASKKLLSKQGPQWTCSNADETAYSFIRKLNAG